MIQLKNYGKSFSLHDLQYSNRRRQIIFALAASNMFTNLKIAWSAELTEDEKNFKIELKKLIEDEDAIDSMRRYKEFSLYFPDLGLERAPLNAQPSKTQISEVSQDLIIECEISNETIYKKKKYDSPVLPGGYSGVTIGIGYDIGHSNPKQFASDWTTFTSVENIERLKKACGKTGKSASPLIEVFADIAIPYENAISQFSKIMLPRYVGLTERSLPNFLELKKSCRGALVDLVYNRGAAFSVPKSRKDSYRYDEMRAVKSLMINRQFVDIPYQLRKMKRLWEGVDDQQGNVRRRELEAQLFEIGMKSRE